MNGIPNKFVPGQIRDTDQAVDALSREFTELRFTQVSDPQRFGLDMWSLGLGRTKLTYNSFHTDTNVDVGPVEDRVLFIFSKHSSSLSNINNQTINLSRSGAIFSPANCIAHARRAGVGLYVLQASLMELEERYRLHTGHGPGGPIIFDNSVRLGNGTGLHAKHQINSVISLLNQDPQALESPVIRKASDEALLNALLALPGSHSDSLAYEQQKSVAPVVVKRAEAYMEANYSKPITVSDLLTVCECSKKALHDGFRKFRNYTPMQFLSRLRLKNAKKRLSSPHKGETVQVIACDCGFTHMGRFSSIYQKTFGEFPRETLNRALHQRQA